jgi:hypothetical protein
MKIPPMIRCSWCMRWGGVLAYVKHANFTEEKNTLDWGQILICKLRRGEPYITAEWIGVIMWCVNPHITNKMLVCVNSKFGHVDDWILLISEPIQSIWVWICRTCWIKFLEHTIVIVIIEIDNTVLLYYSIQYSGKCAYNWPSILNI